MGRDFYLRDYLWGPTGFFSSGYCVLFNKESGWVVTLAAALCLVPSTGQCVWSYETYLYHTALWNMVIQYIGSICATHPYSTDRIHLCHTLLSNNFGPPHDNCVFPSHLYAGGQYRSGYFLVKWMTFYELHGYSNGIKWEDDYVKWMWHECNSIGNVKQKICVGQTLQNLPSGFQCSSRGFYVWNRLLTIKKSHGLKNYIWRWRRLYVVGHDDCNVQTKCISLESMSFNNIWGK